MTYECNPTDSRSQHYAGYLDVDVSHGRNLFYWFAESQKSPTSDPLVLWLNGGPGCSSLGGMFTENGPFVVQNDSSTVKLSPTSWNLVANMLWIEAPAGVGFSYSDDRSDYNTGDLQTAKDNLQAILRFFQKYPNFADREFYIAGESYAGKPIQWQLTTVAMSRPGRPLHPNADCTDP